MLNYYNTIQNGNEDKSYEDIKNYRHLNIKTVAKRVSFLQDEPLIHNYNETDPSDEVPQVPVLLEL